MQKRLKNILRIAFTCVSFAVFALPSASFAQVPDWRITDFDAEITILENGDLAIEEKISVIFNEERRGIYRTIPVIYRDRFNNRVKTDLTIGEILQNGEIAETHISRLGREQKIRIGNEETYLTGDYEYTISYVVKDAILFLNDIDELYWNVTGSDWEVPIENASVTVQMPNGAEVLRTSCYVGAFGSTATDCGIATTQSSAAFVAEDYLTVAIGFTKGVLVPPTVTEKVMRFLRTNSVVFLPIGLLLVVLRYWYQHGKDERLPTIVAEFTPPKNWKAVHASFLLKDRLSKHYLAAMIVQLATEGYLTIDVQGESPKKLKKTFLVKTEKPIDDLESAHKLLYNYFFSLRGSVSLYELKNDTSRSGEIEKIKTEVRNFIRQNDIFAPHSLRAQGIVIVLGVLLGILSIILFANFSTAGLLSGIICAVLIVIIGFYMPKKTENGRELTRQAKGFKLFMHTAERFRSKWQEEQGIFEKYLPYAIAFGDTKQWSKIFTNLPNTENPSWYHSSNNVFVPIAFADSMNSFSRSVATSIAQPQSSGSSGGGSSGGGFGGGGGGSW